MTVLAERRGPGATQTAAGHRPAAALRAWGLPLVIAAACFAVLAPALTWAQFQNSIECIAVGTALETRRDGHWLVPTLGGETRTRKPPLTTWLTAAAIRPETVAGMSSRDEGEREAAFAWFTWEARWPSLAATCLMLLAVYDLGRTLGGRRVGAFAALAGASNLLVLKYGRMTTPDTQLALWVAVTNALLARAILKRQDWLGLAGGGAALGLAFMAKGPVALLMTVVPVMVYLVLPKPRPRAARPTVRRGSMVVLSERAGETSSQGSAAEASDTGFQPVTSIDDHRLETRVTADASPELTSPKASLRRSLLLPLLVGVLLFLAVALPWYATMAARVPRVWSVWFNEVSRAHPADPRPEPWWFAFRFFAMFCPWTVWLVFGLVAGAAAWSRRQSPGLVLVGVLLVVPLLVLAFFPERKDRYRQPLIAPAAVLVGWAVEEHLKRRSESAAGRGTRPAAAGRGRLLDVLHWAVVGTAAVALPVVAATRLAPAIFDMDHVMADWRAGGWAALAGDADLRPWLAPVVAVPCAAAAVVLLACGVASSRFRRPAVLVVATFLCAVLFHALYEYGRRATGESASDMKPMADFIWRQYPDARVYATGRERTQAPVDLNIYLNRPVPPHDTVADLRPAAVPTVVVVFQSRGEAEPASPLRKNERPAPGVLWSRAASFRRGNNWCHAFVLPARQRS